MHEPAVDGEVEQEIKCPNCDETMDEIGYLRDRSAKGFGCESCGHVEWR